MESHRDPIQITVGDTIEYINAAGAELYGASDLDEIVGRSMLAFAPDEAPDARSKAKKAMQARQNVLRQDEKTPSFEYEIKRLDRERRIVESYSVSIEYEGHQAAQTVLRDVTEQRLHEAHLKHRATHDQLTGLLRDSLLRERVRQGLETADERGGALPFSPGRTQSPGTAGLASDSPELRVLAAADVARSEGSGPKQRRSLRATGSTSDLLPNAFGMNPIERLWRWLKQEVLHLHSYAGEWSRLRQGVCNFLDRFTDGSMALLEYTGLSSA